MTLSPKGSDDTLTLEHSATLVPTAKVTCSNLTSTALSGELPGKVTGEDIVGWCFPKVFT